MSGERILVTGGAGFIGSHLVDALLESGADVAVLDNFSSGREENLAHCRDRIEIHRGDIRDLDVCRAACAERQLVFHLAAISSVPRSIDDPSTSIGANVVGSTHVFTAAREAGARRTVYASSSSVYGDSPELPKREGREGAALSPYAASKQMVEELAAVFHLCYGQDLVGLRYFNVYGPRQNPGGPYAAVIPLFFRSALTDEAPRIYGDGEQTRDFTAVADTVRATLRAAAAGPEAAGRAYNIAGGRRTTVNDLARRVLDLTGSAAQPLHTDPRPGDVLHSFADGGAAARDLGYQPTVALDSGLALAFDYYREAFAPDTGSPGRREENETE